MMQSDGNRRLIARGAPQEEEGEEQYRNQCRCRFCCDRAHRGKARSCSLVIVLLLLVVLLVLLLLVLVVLGWLDLTRHQKLGTSPDSTLPASDNKAQMSALRGDGLMKWPAAMLTAPVGNNSDGKYLKWESNFIHAFCYGGFKFSNGDLVVPMNGIYRVFLQITYEGESCSEPEITLQSRVWVYTDSYRNDTRLLSVSDTVKCGPGLWSKSLYSAGLHKLEAKSQLRVTATHRSYLAKNEHEVFFGAELVQRLPTLP